MNQSCCRAFGHSRQAGVALLLGLVILAAISLLAVVATSSMILQQRMASNFSDAQSARQAAAWAVSQGEAYLLGVEQDQRLEGCSARCFLPPSSVVIRQPEDLPPFPEYEEVSWWRNWGVAAGATSSSESPDESAPSAWSFGTQNPRFVISEVHFEPQMSLTSGSEAPPIDGVAYYQILGLGFGKNTTVQAVEEAIVARPWLGAHVLSPTPQPGRNYCATFRPWYDCGRMSWRQRK